LQAEGCTGFGRGDCFWQLQASSSEGLGISNKKAAVEIDTSFRKPKAAAALYPIEGAHHHSPMQAGQVAELPNSDAVARLRATTNCGCNGLCNEPVLRIRSKPVDPPIELPLTNEVASRRSGVLAF
jgi:hypothetical protein